MARRKSGRSSQQTIENRLRFLDALFENIPDMIFVKDAKELRFVQFNRAGEELLGYGRDELFGRNDYDFFPPEEADFFTNRDRAVLDERKLLDIPEETIHTRKKGVRVLHTKKIPIYDDEGNPVYLLGISEDITERKQIDVEREQFYERLRELDRLKTRLIANVSHELRTPLSLIRASADRLLRSGGLGGSKRRDLETISGSAHNVLGLVNDLLDVAKLDAAKLVAEYANVDLARLVRVAASSFEVLAAEKNVTFELDVPATLPAQVDPRKVQRIVENLVSNAFKHVPSGGRVRCSLEVEGEGGPARLIVADSGAGVPPSLRAKIFERFYQAQTERPTGGAGLGLTIVKELVGLHGGSVSVGEASEGGALFIVELPLLAPAGAKVLETDAAAGLVPPPRRAVPRDAIRPERAGAPRVLVVEDNPELNRFLVETLCADFQVITAFDGQAGLEEAARTPPDLVLTDLMMPRLNGEQLIHALRSRPELSFVPIVILTARADDELRSRLLREGAQDYVMKPFSAEELCARVSNLVSLKRARDVLLRELDATHGDVTELAQELGRRRRELASEVRERTRAEEEAKAAVALRDEFLSVASHELRTPLASLVLALHGLLSPPSGKPWNAVASTRMAAIAVRQGDRLTKLVEELLDATRVSSGRLSLEMEDVDLRQLVDRVVAQSQPELSRARCEISVEGEPHVMSKGDRSRLEQVVASLLSNAVKFGAGRPIEISVATSETGALLVVRDHGIGIDPAQHGQIFQRFERAVSSRHYGGLGLGLYICHRIVEAHGGAIHVESRSGEGAVFTVELPSAPQPPPSREARVTL